MAAYLQELLVATVYVRIGEEGNEGGDSGDEWIQHADLIINFVHYLKHTWTGGVGMGRCVLFQYFTLSKTRD